VPQNLTNTYNTQSNPNFPNQRSIERDQKDFNIRQKKKVRISGAESLVDDVASSKSFLTPIILDCGKSTKSFFTAKTGLTTKSAPTTKDLPA
jgi:hypothetical protein